MLIRDKRLAVLAAVLVAFGLLVILLRKDIEHVKIGDATIRAEVADEKDERALGLGGHDSLGENEGMLFEFDSSDTHAIWMKDVEFPLDVIWLDSNKKVVYVEPEMKPNSYPSKFRPATPALYVLEVPAGFVEKNSITNGQKADW